MTLYADKFSVEKFIYELFTPGTFVIEEGRESWDEETWILTMEWKKKWGWLLQENGISDQELISGNTLERACTSEPYDY
jgi:hypothetical protein